MANGVLAVIPSHLSSVILIKQIFNCDGIFDRKKLSHSFLTEVVNKCEWR